MSNEPIEPDEDEDDLDAAAKSTKKENWRRKLEADAEAGRQATQEAALARKELAFLKAGIDINDPENLTPTQKLFVKSYDGEVTAAAVKAAALEYGVVQADPPQVPAAELAAHERIANAANGGVQTTDGDAAMQELLAADDANTVLEILARNGVPIDSARPGSWLRPEGMGHIPVA